MTDYLTVSDAARRLGVRPRDISDLFYQRKLMDASCPLVGGRRLIPTEFLPVIAAALGGKPVGESSSPPGTAPRPLPAQSMADAGAASAATESFPRTRELDR